LKHIKSFTVKASLRENAKKFIFKSLYSSSKSPYAVKITPRVPENEATMTGLPINSNVVQSLGSKRFEIHTPKKGNYRAK